MPKVSIIMPVYNAMPYIREAIDSVFSQEFTDWELIISDNGSTDGTRKLLGTIIDKRVNVYEQKENLGVYGNLNFLLDKASASVAKILCADDLLLAGSLSKVVAFMDANPDCAISRCWAEGDAREYDSGGKWQFEKNLPERLDPAAAVLAFAALGNMVGNLSRAACRPAMVIAAGGFNPQFPYAGDYEGWLRVVRLHGIVLQNEELVYGRVHEMQGSNLLNKRNEAFPQIDRILIVLADQAEQEDRELLIRHWTINFFSPRVPRFIQQIFSGQFQLAFSIWRDLPLGISPWRCIAAYPAWKMKLPWTQETTRALVRRIINRNIPTVRPAQGSLEV